MTIVKVKVCGITRTADAMRASDLGASAVGFIFWKKSRRYVDPDSAKVIAAQLPPDVAPVGVFVDPAYEEVCEVAAHVGLAAVQLHGDESFDFCRGLPYRVVKAVAVGEATTADEIRAIPAEITPLLDAHDPLGRGGTGRTIDWSVASAVARERRVFLSGGLAPNNVLRAIRTVRPYGVDVSSGVEAAPGQKDAERLRVFFEQVARAAWETIAAGDPGRRG